MCKVDHTISADILWYNTQYILDHIINYRNDFELQMGMTMTKEEEDKPTIWLSHSVIARIRGEDVYRMLIQEIENEYILKNGISVKNFNEISKSIEEAISPMKSKTSFPNCLSYGRFCHFNDNSWCYNFILEFILEVFIKLTALPNYIWIKRNQDFIYCNLI